MRRILTAGDDSGAGARACGDGTGCGEGTGCDVSLSRALPPVLPVLPPVVWPALPPVLE
ncbi:hypothetical protein ENSA5_68240 [Enhygromyxa salina]|uniref:Uncharacterized protein n=1 Tax=Enhygromyxa salina TaxID=215803 RepID=A0A2S9XB52_9BACT|nr:hypothetical protein ENSA5_68240 [Enhygromyxa salina]